MPSAAVWSPLGRPEFRAMFLDDLLNGARFQAGAPSPTSSSSADTGPDTPAATAKR